MLVNKSGRKLVIGRINVKNGEVLPGIPYTASERKGIEKFVAKGYIEEVQSEAKADAAVEAKADAAVEAKADAAVEAKAEAAVEAVVEAPKAEEPKAEAAVEAPKAEPAYAKYSRRRKKAAEAEPEAAVTEDGVGSNN